MKIVVASNNPVKIDASVRGFKRMFPEREWSTEGVSVESGVSSQPMTDAETLRGALNRAQNARQAHPDADYWIGLEGGVHDDPEGMLSFGWVVIVSPNSMGKARTPSFTLPPQIAELLRGGMELGQADDIVFKKQNSKQAEGAVGILTGGIFDRAMSFETAVLLALIPFKHPEHYKNENPT